MTFQLEGRIILFATDNVNKFNEARRVLAEFKIAVGMLRIKGSEVQSDSLEEIAKTSVLDSFGRCRLPIIVEDAGLFVDELRGFPGPYAAYVYRTVGNEGLLRLMQNVNVRNAKFESAVAYMSERHEFPVCFKGEVTGEITKKERRGTNQMGFGFDPIFRPDGSEKTFAEMTISEKNGFSHRAMALRRFGEYYKKLGSRRKHAD
jgi:XTP/dITP diphosphohydrolase